MGNDINYLLMAPNGGCVSLWIGVDGGKRERWGESPEFVINRGSTLTLLISNVILNKLQRTKLISINQHLSGSLMTGRFKQFIKFQS